MAPLSADRARSSAAVDELKPWGTTGLHDAIIAAIETMQPAKGRRALVLLSDGNDRYSTATRARCARTRAPIRRDGLSGRRGADAAAAVRGARDADRRPILPRTRRRREPDTLRDDRERAPPAVPARLHASRGRPSPGPSSGARSRSASSGRRQRPRARRVSVEVRTALPPEASSTAIRLRVSRAGAAGGRRYDCVPATRVGHDCGRMAVALSSAAHQRPRETRTEEPRLQARRAREFVIDSVADRFGIGGGRVTRSSRLSAAALARYGARRRCLRA